LRGVQLDLARACQRRLTSAARLAGVGTRQQVRAAARSFVRRHRRDPRYLRLVASIVAASSSFAVALLGLAPTEARAAATHFVLSGFVSPVTILSDLAPALGDLDADGDLDVVVGTPGGGFLYFENTGTATSAAFVNISMAANPLVDIYLVGGATGALVDLDGDGDLDLVGGASDGQFTYIENTGTATTPAFAVSPSSANPLNGFDVGANATPAFADLDCDGDLDLVAGNLDGTFHYFVNSGTANSPAFVEKTGTSNPFAAIDVGSDSAPAFADLDGDGDLDLLAGGASDRFYFENTGTRENPAFIARTGQANPDWLANLLNQSKPAFGDLDADGDLDLVVGFDNGTLEIRSNQAGHMVQQTGSANPLRGFTLGHWNPLTFADFDHDGDLDAVAGMGDGHFTYYENVGTKNAPIYVLRTGTSNPFNNKFVPSPGSASPAAGHVSGCCGAIDILVGSADGTVRPFQPFSGGQTSDPIAGIDVGDHSAPALADLDGDGDLDLLVGERYGTLHYFENTGTPASYAFIERTATANPVDGVDVGDESKPALGDIDGDGDLDLVVGEFTGSFLYFENTGNRSKPVFVPRSGTANPLNAFNVACCNGRSAPTFADLDGDGDLDVMAGGYDGQFHYYENAVVRPSPRYFGPVPTPFLQKDVGFFSNPGAGDLDGDGDPDFVATDSFGSGAFHYFENVGGVVVERFGTANPFDGLSAGGTPPVALGDVDADGDLDLIAGDNYGAPLRYYENTGTAVNPSFVQRTGGANPFAGVIQPRSAPTLGDLDGDGDLDLVVGEFHGNFHYYQNTGNAGSPAFVERTGSQNPLLSLSVGAGKFATPALGDVDRDGDLDLMAGDEGEGRFHYFENTGSATAPAFVARTGPANPLDGKSVGLNSTPTFADLDCDGDLDLVSGERYGEFRTYYLPEPDQGLLLGAGLALLKLLARWRRRPWSETPRASHIGNLT